ncbi:hypothetical protein [Desmospora profundinema]|uniref:Sugar phosphate isomerase/epimerase n=1 Tax=Desmospora profundinema TaxID=1571184 RepID=A0ABU1IJS3_9BACL|nr:hypothetical protein [Desmospora profundinema]MDR6225032.1 sugar phosphate isomerase/epimerase [Desmospora profundinema]
MLFSNPITAQADAELHQMRQVRDQGIHDIELQLPSTRYSREELSDLFQITQTRPVAFRAPENMPLGKGPINLEDWEYWLETAALLFEESPHRYFICHGAAVTLGEVFDYLDARPRDFNALHDYKTRYVETIIDQLKQLEEKARSLDIRLLIENAPMGGTEYFEPGRDRIHPALRTPRHLLRIAEATGTGICLDTAHARITSHVLSYMHRSRSLFAAATEKEILNATRTWIQFYEQVSNRTSLVRLSFAISWGDTDTTHHVPFPEGAYPELLDFADQVDPNLPIILPVNKNQLKEMAEPLLRLKKR